MLDFQFVILCNFIMNCCVLKHETLFHSLAQRTQLLRVAVLNSECESGPWIVVFVEA